jgi:tetratricopeptide (TPR) repeat protein
MKKNNYTTTAHFENIRAEILKQLEKAESSIWAAIAWVTDKKIFDTLIEKLNYGVEVKLIIRKDAINFNENALPWEEFLSYGGELFGLDTLHHKFAVIDGIHLINGSYNWTYFAERRNQENILVIEGDNNQFVTDSFMTEIEALIKKSTVIDLPISRFITPKQQIEPYESQIIREDTASYQQIMEEVGQSEMIENLNFDADADIAFNTMDYEKAVELYQKALNLDANNEKALFGLGWSYLRLSQQGYDTNLLKAQKLLLENQNNFTNIGDYNNLLGCINIEIGNDNEALQNYKKAVNSAKECLEYQWNLYCTLYDMNRKLAVKKVREDINEICKKVIENDNSSNQELLIAYSTRIHMLDSRNNADILEVAINAKAVFNSIQDDTTKNYWEFEQVKKEVAKLPKHMQKKFKEAV